MDKCPKVTAVVRTYNRCELMKKAVRSVQNQDYPNLEIIILDDCSQDETKKVATGLESEDSRIRYIRHNKNSGTGAGFNTGIENANGKYIAFLDDDDLWFPHKTKVQVEKLELLGDEFGMVTGWVSYFDLESGNILEKVFKPTVHDPPYKVILLDSISCIGPPSVVMLRLSSVKEFGLFREDMPRGCCHEYYRRFLKKNKVTSVNMICTNYAEHTNRITSFSSNADFNKALVSHKIKVESIEEDLKEYSSEYSRQLGIIGDLACLSGDTSEGRRYFFKALEVNPINLKVCAAILFSLFGVRVYRSIRAQYYNN